MIERAADTPGRRQGDTVGTASARKVDAVGGRAEADALVGEAAAAEHREVRRGAAGGDHVLGGALGIGRIDLDVVARAGRDVLDLQRRHHRAAPLGFGVTADFGQVVRDSAGVQRVVGPADLMRRGRHLEQTPGLIDPDPADDVGRMRAGIGVRSGAVGADRTGDAQIVDSGAIPDGRIVETDRGRYAVAELGGVLDVVDAGVGVVAAEQARADVARKAVPGGRVSRRGLTEGEAGELDEEVLDGDIAAASGPSARSSLRRGNL